MEPSMIATYRRAAAALDRVPDVVLVLSRVALGVLFIDHGLQKYSGPGGVAGFEGFLRSLPHLPAPALTSEIVPALEIGGGVLLIAGLLTRVIAVVLAGEMAVTGFVIKAVDLHQPLVSRQGAGVELDLVYLVLLVTVLTFGPGRVSLDRFLGLERPSTAAVPAPAPAPRRTTQHV
jgi:putative oxidoreductase